jgi:isopentenyl diphosphate isomerase/L-lactate dehydrogenase-like FMN-dependent dehydrogenase
MRRFHSVDQAQRLARRRVPASVYRFIEGGTDAEVTVVANRAAYRDITFLPRAGVVHPEPDLRVSVLGLDLSMPVVLAPAGYIRLAHRDGEAGAARAAARAGVAIGVSTLASHDVFDITATGAPTLYQLYFAGGRAGAEIAVDRAKEAGCRGLVVTLDLAASAARERALRGGAIPTRVTARNALRYAPELVTRPAWLRDFVRDGLRLDVPNVRTEPGGAALSAAQASKSMRANAPRWEDFAWLRERWAGPLVAKGLLRADDARRAVDAGADAIVVSNHGGNALDSTPPTMHVLPGIVDAVGGRVPVLVDGGIRRGSDVVKAVALGARAVLIGRAYIWGLAAGGEAGVGRVLDLLRADIARTLTLLGCPSVEALDRSYVDAPWLPAT